MYSDGHEVDGSWVLRVYVTDLQVERSLRVKGELHIGGVMLRLVEDLGEFLERISFSVNLSTFKHVGGVSLVAFERGNIRNSNPVYVDRFINT